MSVRNMIAGLGWALMLTATAPALSQDSLEERFKNPPIEALPRVRWWWPGNAVSDAELQREISVLAQAGFGGAEIQSLKTVIPNLTDAERGVIDDYATPNFFAHVKVAVDAARARGLTLDYTFGSAWPSGGGFAITPERALLELTLSRTEVVGGTRGPIKLVLPERTQRFCVFGGFGNAPDSSSADWPARFNARSRIVAVIAVRGTAPDMAATSAGMGGLTLYPFADIKKSGVIEPDTSVVLTDRMAADGTLDWTPPPGTWQVFVFRQHASNSGLLGAAGKGPQLVLDHFDRAAFAAHAERVGDPMLAALGPSSVGLRATFVDSLELMQDLPWTENFLFEFKARRGYDLTPYLPFILQPGWMVPWSAHWSAPQFDAGDSTGERVRADYRQTVSDLMFDGFVTPFVAWNHAHGLRTKFQAHGGPHDLLKAYGAADIPETESLGGNNPLGMRMARSAADIYGRPIISSETLGWANRPYSPTLDDLRRLADVNFVAGVNSLNYHGFNYRRANDKWPGWHAFAPGPFSPGFGTPINETNPLWAGVPRLNGYVARMQSVLQQGHSVVPVAYFYGEIGDNTTMEPRGDKSGDPTPSNLIAGGYDFDWINPDGLLKSHVEGGALVTPGGARFRILVLPRIEGIGAEVAEKIALLTKQGLPVLFIDGVPHRDVTLHDQEARDARVRVAMNQTRSHGVLVAEQANVLGAIRGLRIEPNLTFTANERSGLAFVQRKIGERIVTMIANTSAESRDSSVILPRQGGVTRWDAMEGTQTRVSSRRLAEGVGVALSLEAGESVLLVQDLATAPAESLPQQKAGLFALPAVGWKLSVVGHGLDGTAIERNFDTVALGDWRTQPQLTNFSGEGIYRRSFSLPRGWLARQKRVILDLGEVHDMAIVSVNGHALPALIGAPFRADITPILKSGTNTLSIAVYNSPNNAMSNPATEALKHLKPLAAGLIGPVHLGLERLPSRR